MRLSGVCVVALALNPKPETLTPKTLNPFNVSLAAPSDRFDNPVHVTATSKTLKKEDSFFTNVIQVQTEKEM